MTETQHNFLEYNKVVSVDDITDNNDCWVSCEYEKMKSRSSASTHFEPSLDKLKFGVLQYIHNNKSELLECKVEKVLMERDHSILCNPQVSILVKNMSSKKTCRLYEVIQEYGEFSKFEICTNVYGNFGHNEKTYRWCKPQADPSWDPYRYIGSRYVSVGQ